MEQGKQNLNSSFQDFSKSNGSCRDESEVELIFKITEHKYFQEHLNKHAAITCEQVLQKFKEEVRSILKGSLVVIIPLLSLSVSLVIYIFATSTASINRLNDSVVILTSTMSGVEKTLAVIQTNQQNSKENIDKLNEKIYGK